MSLVFFSLAVCCKDWFCIDVKIWHHNPYFKIQWLNECVREKGSYEKKTKTFDTNFILQAGEKWQL